MRRGLTGNSSTGVWVAANGGRLFGPFDGKSPAMEFRRRMKRDFGIDVELQRVESPADAVIWAELREREVEKSALFAQRYGVGQQGTTLANLLSRED